MFPDSTAWTWFYSESFFFLLLYCLQVCINFLIYCIINLFLFFFFFIYHLFILLFTFLGGDLFCLRLGAGHIVFCISACQSVCPSVCHKKLKHRPQFLICSYKSFMCIQSSRSSVRANVKRINVTTIGC